MCVISLCTRGALDTWSRRRSTAALGDMHTLSRIVGRLSAPALFVLFVVPLVLSTVGSMAPLAATIGSFLGIYIWLGWHAGMIGRLSALNGRPVPAAYFVLVAIAVVYLGAILVGAIVFVIAGDADLVAFGERLEEYEGMLAPLHVLAMAGLVFSAWTAARRLVDAEQRAPATWARSLGTWVVIWFFPIGVWFVQPRFRRVANVA
jgi:hypothetical protein